MIFYLDCSVEALRACEPSKRDDVIRELLRTGRRGDHLVIFPRQASEFIYGNSELTKAEREYVLRLRDENTQTAMLVSKATSYIRVVISNDAKKCSRAITVDFDSLRKSRLMERTVLLVENRRRDGFLYDLLMRAISPVLECPRPLFDLCHGGGEDVKDVLTGQISDGRIVCCVVDADRSAPAVTAAKVDQLRRLVDQLAWPYATCSAPPCREAENCLPMDLVMALPSGRSNPDNKHYREIAEAELASGCCRSEAFWLFVDLKEGIDFDRVSENETAVVASWVSSKRQLLSGKALPRRLQGYGSKILTQLEDDGACISELRRFTRSRAWRDIFTAFLEPLLWSCAARPGGLET